MLKLREALKEDLVGLLQLYTQLHNNSMPPIVSEINDLWNSMLTDRNYHIIVGVINNMVISSCTIVIIPNLTHNQKPYALIENVISHENYRGKGYATSVLEYAKDIAVKNDCYKIMLLTGSKKESTLNFYRKAGYNSDDKTGLIQWL